jgi:hypothetical protein
VVAPADVPGVGEAELRAVVGAADEAVAALGVAVAVAFAGVARGGAVAVVVVAVDPAVVLGLAVELALELLVDEQ